jgi:phosphatidylserine/phosphatidylglycerophosphate/cardiolipin synthase-like enzyme
MMTWVAAAAGAPVFLLGVLWPGFGDLPAGQAPPDVIESLASVELAPTSPGYPLFNDPTGPTGQQYALVAHVDRMVDGAGRGSTVRLAAYSFALPGVANHLAAAHRRGVNVQMVVDDHARGWPSVRRLTRALGTNVHRHSFVRVCHGACRGGPGNQHAKFMTLSDSRGQKNVVLVGSMNYTGYSAEQQWNDLYTVSDADVYSQFVHDFQLMTLDRRQGRVVFPDAGRGLDLQVAPLPGWAPSNDPIVTRLSQVRCDGAAFDVGKDGHTVIRIELHAWNGSRGMLLARRVAGLARSGCDIKVLYGVGMGPHIAPILRAAGVPTRSSAYAGRHTHEKLMILSGRFGDLANANYVWTGSQNWSNRSLVNDEVTLRIAGADNVKAYLADFDRIWAKVS